MASVSNLNELIEMRKLLKETLITQRSKINIESRLSEELHTLKRQAGSIEFMSIITTFFGKTNHSFS